LAALGACGASSWLMTNDPMQNKNTSPIITKMGK
jgi:hypothetical protein